MSQSRSCIHVFDDRIEFINPGGMPMPLEQMEKSFESQPRNPVIAKLFRLAHLSENLGYGIQKLKKWQEITGRPMHIDTTINSVKVTFNLQTRESITSNNVPVNVPVKLTQTQQKVLKLISDNPAITHTEIAKTLSINEKTAKRATQALRESKLITREGSDKNGTWILL